MSKLLIAEISNMHLGDIDAAKHLIISAKNAGADIVKSQVFDPEDMARLGTMPLEFYEKCALMDCEIKELIAYGADHGIPVFFTILSPSLQWVSFHQKWQKIHARAWNEVTDTSAIDSPDHIISMNQLRPYGLNYAQILCATDYGKPINLELYDDLFEFYERPIGISHHNIVLDDLLTLISSGRNIPIIEKHFHLGGTVQMFGATYRDSFHAARPEHFEHLAMKYKG